MSTESVKKGEILFLKSLPYEERAFYSRWFKEEILPKHTTVFYQGDKECNFYEIGEGQVKISKFTADGKEITIEILKEGDRFGFVPLADGGNSECTATTLGKTTLYAIGKADFDVIMKKYPHLLNLVIEDSCKRIRQSYTQLENLASGGSKSRIAHLILEMARQEGDYEDGVLSFNIRLTHQELANLAGTSRETVTRVLSYLKNNKYIKVKRSIITILDEDMLEGYILDGE